MASLEPLRQKARSHERAFSSLYFALFAGSRLGRNKPEINTAPCTVAGSVCSSTPNNPPLRVPMRRT